MASAAYPTWLDPDREDLVPVAYDALGPLRLRYTPIRPTVPQEAFLRLTGPEVFFGGAAGPGKSAGLLASALQYADVPGYAALLLRRTYQDLALPGALIDMASSWLAGTDARWSGIDKTWRFPNRATLSFGYLQTDKDKRRYSSAEFQFVGFDELTHFPETSYTFLFSRLRRPSRHRGGHAPDGLSVNHVPLRMRSASNPGGPGHDWVQRRFVDPETRAPNTLFLPARAIDNPHLDVAAYLASLAHLSPVERRRLMAGDWDVRESGGVFDRTRFPIIHAAPPPLRVVRAWDLAATPPSTASPDPDWTVGTLMQRDAGGRTWTIRDVRRFRKAPGAVKREVVQAAKVDGRSVAIRIEQEPGSSGKALVADYKQTLRGWDVRGVPATGDKVTRAGPLAAAADDEVVRLLAAEWVSEWLSEVEAFPLSSHDDQVDSASAAFAFLAQVGRARGASAAGQSIHRA